MRAKMIRRLALIEMKKPERLKELAEHQQNKVKELESKSLTELAVAIQQCYRHRVLSVAESDRRQATLISRIPPWTSMRRQSSGRRSAGESRSLQDLNKLRLPGDEPDSPTYIRDRTPLRKGQITVAALRESSVATQRCRSWLRTTPLLRRSIKGVEQGEYVYRRGDLLYGKGDPMAMIIVDEQSVIFTSGYAQQHGIWPRQADR